MQRRRDRREIQRWFPRDAGFVSRPNLPRHEASLDQHQTPTPYGAGFRNEKLDLPFHDGPEFTREALTKTLQDPNAKTADRILAAMSLSSRDRIERGQKIDLPSIDLGPAQIVVFPGEAFVGYQLLAQKLRPDAFVLSIGYGECWPGYIPTQSAFEDGFNHGWRWVSPGCERTIQNALKQVLADPDKKK